jgi:hypothetical protein
MLIQSRNTWKNWLTWLVAVWILFCASVSIAFLHEPAKSPLNTQAPVSLYSYFQDYALLSSPIRIDSKSYKVKINGSNITGATLSEHKKAIYALPHCQNLCQQSLGRISTRFAETDATSQKWLSYACHLLDLPPPPPTNFIASL